MLAAVPTQTKSFEPRIPVLAMKSELVSMPTAWRTAELAQNSRYLGAEAASRWTPGTPRLAEPRKVLPSQAMASPNCGQRARTQRSF